MENQLRTIVELQTGLDDLKAAKERLHGIPDWMKDLHEEHSTHKAEIDALEADIEAAGAERRVAEAEMQTCQEKLKTYQEQIGLVRNQREYGALLHEIDTTKTQVKSLEEQAFAAMERQDQTRKSLEEKREGFQELDARYGAELKKWDAEKPEVEKQIEALEGRIETLRERLPRGLATQFDRIFERHEGRALAQVHQMERRGRAPQMWHCGVCNFRVRPQAVVEIVNHGRVVLCDSCKRILYIDEAED